MLHGLNGSEGNVYNVSVSDGSGLIELGVGGFTTQNETRVWDTEGQPLGDPYPGGTHESPLTHDGRSLLIANEAGVTIWNLDPDFWEQQACLAAGRNLTQDEWDDIFPDRDYEVICPRWPSGAAGS